MRNLFIFLDGSDVGDAVGAGIMLGIDVGADVDGLIRESRLLKKSINAFNNRAIIFVTSSSS